jgi:predicted HAD superfamily Cof-like phosphohydrolase
MTNPAIPKFKSFEASVLYFNGMYKLPIAPVPSLLSEKEWQEKRLNMRLTSLQAFKGRMEDFFQKILVKEIKEHEAIIISMEGGAEEIDILTDLADLLGDIQVYCASEMARFGLPNEEVLKIIMASNFSKLDENGNPIYDEDGKVCKGPNYWKPEPAIKSLLLEMQGARNE